MPRSPRIVIPGLPHHVTHCGNNRQNVFFSIENYAKYLGILKNHSSAYGLLINGYCLITNHIHLIVTPKTESSLADTIGKAHGHYTQYINAFQNITGHLWENRFYSCPMDHNHFIYAMRYIERNPVRAGLVEHPEDYEWSSARMHLGQEDPWKVVDWDIWLDCVNKSGIDWGEWLALPEKKEVLESIRKHTISGKHWKD